MIKTKLSSVEYSYKKPKLEDIPEGTQLFSRDINKDNGSKMFLTKSYEEIYSIIKNEKIKCYYEDHTYNTKIKLHIDIDIKKEYIDKIDRDDEINIILDNLLNMLNLKIEQVLNIKNPRIIVLVSNTLLKLSIHIIYVDILFDNIYSMGDFMKNYLSIIDKSIYKKGCFRMLYCNKLGKYNTLIYYKGYNYEIENDYQLFIDSCLCSNNILDTVDYILINDDFGIVNKSKPIIKNIKHEIVNYKYTKPDFDIIKKVLEKVSLKDYDDWFRITCAIKNLYLGLEPNDAEHLYYMYDDECSKYHEYDRYKNKDIFDNLKSIISINYLFYTANIKYKIKPIYKYKEFMFNPNKYKNIIIDDSKYINVDINELVKYKLICLKGPTGIGKTRYLNNIINHLNIKNIISITSRTNLAGEHKKSINLKFYKDLDYNEINYCNKLVIQLESLHKCNYQLFEYGIVILDEINSLLSHLRSPTMNNKRATCYKYLMKLIKNAKHIIAMDADFCDWNFDFIKEIDDMDYIIYYNTIKNKLDVSATFYLNDQILINKMIDDINNNKYFIACFDSLTYMNHIIEYIDKQVDNFDPLYYSSEVNYNLIDTSEWNNKFVFYTPTIIYGISYEDLNRDVYCFIYKKHLNPLQIYQMINRVRKLDNVHIYCHDKLNKITYDDINMVELEENNKIKTFRSLFESFESGINEKSYNIMYHNFKFMDMILKTNIKYYLIDMMADKGFNIKYNNIVCGRYLKVKNNIDKKEIIDRLVSILNLNKNKLDDFHHKLVTNDGNSFEKHINLRVWFDGDTKMTEKIFSNIQTNLFSETLNSKFMKLKYCYQISKILNIFPLENLTIDISNKFNSVIDNQWLNDNLMTIIKTFRFSENKYNTNNYYKLYQMYISMLKQLFDEELLISKRIKINNKNYIYNILNTKLYDKHIKLMKDVKLKDLLNCNFID